MPGARQARPTPQPLAGAQAVGNDFFRQRWARADNRHLATDDVEQLGQFVDRGAAQPAANTGNARVFRHFETRAPPLAEHRQRVFATFGIHNHRAKLPQPKGFARFADTHLGKEHGATVIQPDEGCYSQKQRRKDNQRQHRKENVGSPFHRERCAFTHPLFTCRMGKGTKHEGRIADQIASPKPERFLYQAPHPFGTGPSHELWRARDRPGIIIEQAPDTENNRHGQLRAVLGNPDFLFGNPHADQQNRRAGCVDRIDEAVVIIGGRIAVIGAGNSQSLMGASHCGGNGRGNAGFAAQQEQRLAGSRCFGANFGKQVRAIQVFGDLSPGHFCS